MNLPRLSLALLLALLWGACGEDAAHTPKPRTYPRIFFPEKAWQPFGEAYCPFRFEYPAYASIEQDTLFFDERPAHPCWFDIAVPSLGGRIHCTYAEIGSRTQFDELVADAHDLANKHNIRADYIDELQVQKPNGVAGFVFDIDGPAASPFQFYLTDSTRHFLRGAVYFNTASQPDSLAPVFEFIKADVMHLVNTFEFR